MTTISKMLKSFLYAAVCLAPVATALTSKSILDVLADNPNLSTLHAAVSASKDVSALLSSPGHLTLFAPSNDAFLSYPMADYKVKYLLDPAHENNLASLLSVCMSNFSCVASSHFVFVGRITGSLAKHETVSRCERKSRLIFPERW